MVIWRRENIHQHVNGTAPASKLADEGKVPEAKAEAAKLKDLMKEYHGKLGV